MLAEFGLLHHWVAELQNALEAAGVVDDGGADLFEGFDGAEVRLDGHRLTLTLTLTPTLTLTHKVRLDGHGDKVPADALSKLVGVSVLEAMVARLPTKEQHLATLGLGLEASLQQAARALAEEDEEDARAAGRGSTADPKGS